MNQNSLRTKSHSKMIPTRSKTRDRSETMTNSQTKNQSHLRMRMHWAWTMNYSTMGPNHLTRSRNLNRSKRVELLKMRNWYFRPKKTEHYLKMNLEGP